MSRDTVASVTSATSLPAIRWAMLAKVGVSAGTIYACTGNRFITDGVNTYSPVAGLGGVESVKEESTLFPRSLKLWLAAVGSANLAEPLTENMFNKTVRLYRAVLTDSLTLVGTPQQCFRGFINKVDIHMGDPQKGNYYELEVESRIRREAASNFYTTENHDQMVSGTYSGDTIFKFIPRISGFQSKWGGQTQTLDGAPTGRQGGGGRGRGDGGGR